MISVSGLYIYPIKACRGLPVQAFRLDDLGPQLDRRFMLIDEAGRFISQRTAPRLALVDVAIHPTSLLVSAPGMSKLKLPLALPDRGALIEFEIRSHRGPAIDAGADAGEWFSEWLGQPCRLVRCPPAKLRLVDAKYSPEEAYTAFTDGFPELLMTEASVADLGRRANQVFPMDRFRPNVVLTGSEPYAEDGWKRLRIGEIELDVVKPCSRCVVTTVDQKTGVAGAEPLATLATYRQDGNKVMLGQNCVHRGIGTLRVGDPVEVLAP